MLISKETEFDRMIIGARAGDPAGPDAAIRAANVFDDNGLSQPPHPLGCLKTQRLRRCHKAYDLNDVRGVLIPTAFHRREFPHTGLIFAEPTPPPLPPHFAGRPPPPP